jgi:tetratricopeptide (TPR) repeat protein
MKRAAGLFWLSVIFFLLFVGSAFAAEVLTNDAIVTMVKASLGEELIIGKIRISEPKYDLSTDTILKLKNDGVSEAIIKAMIEASAPPPGPQPKTSEALAKETQDAIALYRHGKGAEAVAAFDKLLAERPTDDNLRIWKALALLEQARALKDATMSGYKPLVANAYAMLQPLGRQQVANPDWNLAMARAFWLNDRPTWASRAAGKAIALRTNFAEAQLVIGDLAYDAEFSAINAPSTDPRRELARRFAGVQTRPEYEKALAMPDLSAPLRAEVLYKLGLVSSELEGKKESAREYWQRAVSADPGCRYGVLAEQQLKAAPRK